MKRNSETITECTGRKTEGTTQIDETKESQDNMNKKLIELTKMVQGIFENIERINIDMTNLKKNVAEVKEK